MAARAAAELEAMPKSEVPSVLDRRFEAVVFDWDGTAVPDRRADASRVRLLIERLCATGMDVFVVSGTHVGNVDGQLAARPAGPGELYLCLNRGSEVFQADRRGVRVVHRRTATRREDAALDRAATLTVERLAKRGLEAAVVSERLNRRKIDVIPLPAWADPPKARIDDLVDAVERRLRAAGFTGLPAVVDLALAAAADAGIPDPRVTSDAKHVEIGLTDKTDSARWIVGRLRSRGVSSGMVLIAGDELGPLGGLPGSDSLMLVPELCRATVVSVGVEPSGVPDGVVHVGGGPARFVAVLQDQLRRRLQGEPPGLDEDQQWTIAIRGVDPALERVHESHLTIADGTIGTNGSPLMAHPSARPEVLAAGAYDGPETRLLPGPLWERLDGALPADGTLERVMDLRTGVLAERFGGDGSLRSVRFSSQARPGISVLRVQGDGSMVAGRPPLVGPAEAVGLRNGARSGTQWISVRSDQSAITASADQTMGDAADGRAVTLDRIASHAVGSPGDRTVDRSITRAATAEWAGFERLLVEHRSAWARRWSEADVVIEGDPVLQRDVRFALFHLMSSVASMGEAAVGARGLSGSAYGGHVFWDADVFVLPFLAATHPAAARAMLEYRIRRLPAALAAARALGRDGARFPWESAATGRDVTPRSTRDRTGRVVPIRTGQLEEHIVADVAWAACRYADWTGDLDFLAGPGRPLVVETARYWASRARWDAEGRAHLYGVIGPDEYHEPVDDNAFTNVMARWNLRRAAALLKSAGIGEFERLQWIETADGLVDGLDPRTGRYEQFAGFYGLEPLIVADFAPRRPIAADLLLGRDRVRGAQVVKQADVLMLHHLVPEETEPGSLLPNLEYYEPRTAHGSSLSPAIHASLFARAGRLPEAVDALRLATRVDLDDLTGTSAGGLHLATMGGVWQALAFGFAGLQPEASGLRVDPRLPDVWPAFEMRVRFHSTPIRLRVEPDKVRLQAEHRTPILLGDAATPVRIGPGERSFEHSGYGWKEAGS